MTKPASTRSLALEILERWSNSNDFIDGILRAMLVAADGLAARDRHLVHELSFGVLRHLRELDFLIGQLVNKPLDSKTRNTLRLGIYQILFTRVADHAAVNETVSTAGRAKPLVNAVLRRFLREQQQLLAILKMQPLAVRYSHPDPLVQRWSNVHSSEVVTDLMRLNNEPPQLTIRVNGLRSAAQRIDESGKAQPLPGYPEMRVVSELPSNWLANGDCYMQDPSTIHACRMLAPLAGERVLDACAAPGGKAAMLAELMQGQGQLVAVDSDASRLKQLGSNLSRMQVENVEFTLLDWTRKKEASAAAKEVINAAPFDRILVDAPCTNTGVLRRRVDARWRLGEHDLQKMPQIQLGILEGILPHLKPGGALVYSTCSLEEEENQGVIEQLLARHHELVLLDTKQVCPWTDGYDGAFAALLELRS